MFSIENQGNSVGKTKSEEKGKWVTWIPARDERETGLFLSLSLSLLAAVVFPATRPFPPFPAIDTQRE